MNKMKKVLCTLGVILLTAVFLIPFFTTLLVSFTDYRVTSGLLGSPIVGFKNFAQIIGSAYFPKIAANTLFISLIGTAAGCVYVFLSSLSVGSSKNPFLKAFLTLIFMLPALIPVNILTTLFSTDASSAFLRIAVSLADGLRVASFAVMASFFIENNVLKGSVKCLLLFISFRLIYFFTTDMAVVLGVYSPANYDTLDVFSTYTYRISLMNGDFSSSAAVHVLKAVLQIVPAAVGCVILAKITGKGQKYEPISRKSFMAASVFAIIPIVLFICVIITGGSLLPSVFNKTVIAGGINEFLIVFASAAIVTVFAAALALLAKNSRVAGIVALALLCVTGNCIPGEYIIARALGIYGTVFAVIFKNLYMISFLAIIFTFIISKTDSLARCIAAFAMGFAAMFAGFWGNYVSSSMMLTNRATYPLSLILKELTASGAVDASPARLTFSTVPYILIPIAVAAIGLAVCAIVKALKSKDFKNI